MGKKTYGKMPGVTVTTSGGSVSDPIGELKNTPSAWMPESGRRGGAQDALYRREGLMPMVVGSNPTPRITERFK